MKTLGINTRDGWSERRDGGEPSHLVTPSRKGVTPRCDALKPACLLALREMRHTVTRFFKMLCVYACAHPPARDLCFYNDLFEVKRFDGMAKPLSMRLSKRHTLRHTLKYGV